MAMRLEHEFTVPAPVEQAWAMLSDVERVVPCLPGATLDSAGGGVYAGRMQVEAGSSTVTYRGDATLDDVDKDAHTFTLKASGEESRGSGTATAEVTARLISEGELTRVRVGTSLDVTGPPAQLGREVIADAGGKLVARFAAGLAALLEEGHGEVQGDEYVQDEAQAQDQAQAQAQAHQADQQAPVEEQFPVGEQAPIDVQEKREQPEQELIEAQEQAPVQEPEQEQVEEPVPIEEQIEEQDIEVQHIELQEHVEMREQVETHEDVEVGESQVLDADESGGQGEPAAPVDAPGVGSAAESGPASEPRTASDEPRPATEPGPASEPRAASDEPRPAAEPGPASEPRAASRLGFASRLRQGRGSGGPAHPDLRVVRSPWPEAAGSVDTQPEGVLRTYQTAEEEALELLEVAGTPLIRRLAPVMGALATVAVLAYVVRRLLRR